MYLSTDICLKVHEYICFNVHEYICSDVHEYICDKCDTECELGGDRMSRVSLCATTGTLTPPRPSSLHSTMLPASHLNANLCHASRCSALQCIAYKTLDTGKVMQINGNPAFPAFNNVVSLTSECKLNAIQCNLL